MFRNSGIHKNSSSQSLESNKSNFDSTEQLDRAAMVCEDENKEDEQTYSELKQMSDADTSRQMGNIIAGSRWVSAHDGWVSRAGRPADPCRDKLFAANRQ
jgi:hypothetical protein